MICLPVGDLENMVDWLHICCIGELMAVVEDFAVVVVFSGGVVVGLFVWSGDEVLLILGVVVEFVWR